MNFRRVGAVIELFMEMLRLDCHAGHVTVRAPDCVVPVQQAVSQRAQADFAFSYWCLTNLAASLPGSA